MYKKDKQIYEYRIKMYLETFLLIVLSAGAVQAQECPTCFSGTSLQDCDTKIKMRSCDFTTSRCMTYVDPERYYKRYCATEEEYVWNADYCKNNDIKECKVASCKQSGCKAEFQDSECPECSSYTSLQDCDNKIKMVSCDFVTSRCLTRIQDNGKYFIRDCVTEKNYELQEAWCYNNDSCKVTSCKKPGCFAEFNGSECPICESDTSLQDCDTKIKMESCDFTTSLCMTYVKTGQYYNRSCVTDEVLSRYAYSCYSSGDCKVTSCKMSGCLAEFKDSECPICNSYTSLQDCNTKAKMQSCDFATSLCMTYVQGRRYYNRYCGKKKHYKAQEVRCSSNDNDCKVASCKQSGCFAEFKDSER